MTRKFLQNKTITAIASSILILLSINMRVFGQTADARTVEGLFAGISDKVGSINTIKFSFTQNIYIADSTQTVKADVLFRRPDSLCVKYSQPQVQEIYYHEGYMYTYLPKIGQATRQKRDAVADLLGITTSIILAEKPLANLRQKFRLSIVNDNSVILRAEPVDPAMEFDDMTISFNASTFLPVNTIVKASYFSSQTHFSQYSVNPEIDDSSFEFEPSEKVNVIEID